ncbi:alcohol dehydrogenase catalytic domain-containing protein [Nonomuraea diastatica]|nr:alcohol dehydrogenase catalytic domain-containing protein [Nonomuraea diastatica]
MRAVVVQQPGTVDALEPGEVPAPAPGSGEITIEVEYAGVGFVDTLFRAGAFDFPTPFIPGIEVTGRVREVGDGVTGFEAGQPVGALLNDFGRAPRAGGYAEVATAPRLHGRAHPRRRRPGPHRRRAGERGDRLAGAARPGAALRP